MTRIASKRGGSFGIAVRGTIALSLAVVLGAVASVVARRLGVGELAGIAVSFGVALPLAALGVRAVLGPSLGLLGAVSDGLIGLAEDDHSLRVRAGRDDEVGELVDRFNRLGEALRARTDDVHQRELLLQTIIEAAPMAIVLCDDADRVVLANAGARQLLGRADLPGLRFEAVVADEPAALREAIAASHDVIITLERGGVPIALHVARRSFRLDTRSHDLVLLRPLTREVARREALTYKNAVRLINHELNNSMAPLSSLLHSARLITGRWSADSMRAEVDPTHAEKLAAVLDVVQERTAHLRSFLEGYAELARLPPPVLAEVAWRPLLETVASLYPLRILAVPETPGRFDAAQMQQLLINLVKNAVEAGSAPSDVEVSVEVARDGGTEIRVSDRGKGASDDILQKAMLPFFSAKEGGLGVGLALCREIATAHGGDLAIARRDPGPGVSVVCWIPGDPPC